MWQFGMARRRPGDCGECVQDIAHGTQAYDQEGAGGRLRMRVPRSSPHLLMAFEDLPDALPGFVFFGKGDA